MSDEILKKLLYKVDKMECKIASAASLNGGFDKLLSEVEHIKESKQKYFRVSGESKRVCTSQTLDYSAELKS